MKFGALFPVAMAVLANQTTAEPLRQPYKLNNARMSVRDIFGLQARQDGAYTPDQEFCGTGNTCAEACGTGYEQCPSRDGNTHCFHAAAKQECCFNLSGEACDDGFYCAADEKAATWCCPNELGLKECAAKFNLPVLSTQTPSPTKTSTKATSTAKPTTSTLNKVTTTSEASPSPTEPTATVSITGKSSSLVNVETSSTISSTFSSSSLATTVTTTTRIESATSAVESTDAQTFSTITSGTESAPAADCTTYTTALIIALTSSSIAATTTATTTVGTTPTSSVANSTVISPGTTTTAPPNPIKVSAANGRGAICGTLAFGMAVAIVGFLF